MSEQQTTEATETEAVIEQQTDPKPSETVDFWKQKAREQEKRAKANADAATKLAEIEQAQKSESERSADRIKQLETEVQNAQTEALRFKVASQFGIGDEDADLFLTASDEETLKKQAERLAAREGERKNNGNYVAREGAVSTAPPEDEMREFTKQLFQRPS